MVFHDGEAYWLRVTNLVQTVKGKASMVGVSLMRNALCWSSAPFPRSSLRHEVLPLGQGARGAKFVGRAVDEVTFLVKVVVDRAVYLGDFLATSSA